MQLQTVPAVMRAAELYDVDDLRIAERAVPELEPGDMLVRIVASGICSGDLMPWYIRRKAPLVLGHEPAGIVVNAAGRFSPGDRVAIHHHAPCFGCRACKRGSHVQCPTWRSTRIDPGGIAEFVRVPAANLADTHLIPKVLDWSDAVLTEPLGCVMKSLRRARLRSGDVVYVIGLGIMGLLHVAVLRASGFTVVASDFAAERRERARALGAHAVCEPAQAEAAIAEFGNGADVVICGPGTPQALAHACERAADDGTVVMFTPLPPDERFEFDQSRHYFRDITLTASYSCGPDDTSAALTWLAQNGVRAADLGVVRYPLARTAAAYRSMVRGEIIKAVIMLDGSAQATNTPAAESVQQR